MYIHSLWRDICENGDGVFLRDLGRGFVVVGSCDELVVTRV